MLGVSRHELSDPALAFGARSMDTGRCKRCRLALWNLSTSTYWHVRAVSDCITNEVERSSSMSWFRENASKIGCGVRDAERQAPSFDLRPNTTFLRTGCRRSSSTAFEIEVPRQRSCV
jgi:hypothetical protein